MSSGLQRGLEQQQSLHVFPALVGLGDVIIHAWGVQDSMAQALMVLLCMVTQRNENAFVAVCHTPTFLKYVFFRGERFTNDPAELERAA